MTKAKKKAVKKDDTLAVNGTFADVIKISVKEDKKPAKKAKKKS